MEIDFVPLVPWGVFMCLTGVAVIMILLGLRNMRIGFALRIVAICIGLLALSGPVLRYQDIQIQPDILVIMRDNSASQQLSERQAQTDVAVDHIIEQADQLGLEVREFSILDGMEGEGTQAMHALARALDTLPRDRISAVVIITDGLIHDTDWRPANFSGPLHVVLTGEAQDWDRRLKITSAPAFGIVGEPWPLRLQVLDDGSTLENVSALLRVAFDGGEPFEAQVPIGRKIDLTFNLPHGGVNVVQISTPEAGQELTAQNNTAALQVNGVRDRLRVLLVNGTPYNGGRTWRNLLKSDAAVDLVQFTILRDFDSQDFTPETELSLIAFPTRELFLEKIDEFDLIIFDRYPLRGILNSAYLESLRSYAQNGGAILIAAGPDFAGPQSLYRSALADIIPARPTARIIEQAFIPKLTDLGLQHPVTRDLNVPDGNSNWGSWLRQIEVEPQHGSVVMVGANDLPLLILDDVDQGRVALLASDQAWLWARGYDGGGPQAELLRRVAHWLMKEPELEAERLSAKLSGRDLIVSRATLEDMVPDLRVGLPDGSDAVMSMIEGGAGSFSATLKSPDEGMYRFSQGDLETVFVVGPPISQELSVAVSTHTIVAPTVDYFDGKMFYLRDVETIRLRMVRNGGRTYGDDWIGLPRRNIETVTASRLQSILPPAIWMVLFLGMILLGWIVDSRRHQRS